MYGIIMCQYIYYRGAHYNVPSSNYWEQYNTLTWIPPTLAMKTFSWSRRLDFNFSLATKTLRDLLLVKVAKYLNF